MVCINVYTYIYIYTYFLSNMDDFSIGKEVNIPLVGVTKTALEIQILRQLGASWQSRAVPKGCSLWGGILPFVWIGISDFFVAKKSRCFTTIFWWYCVFFLIIVSKQIWFLWGSGLIFCVREKYLITFGLSIPRKTWRCGFASPRNLSRFMSLIYIFWLYEYKFKVGLSQLSPK